MEGVGGSNPFPKVRAGPWGKGGRGFKVIEWLGALVSYPSPRSEGGGPSSAWNEGLGHQGEGVAWGPAL